jgi:hypothetical protein
MAQYQLKVMLNTSIPTSVGYTELTIDMLNYDPPPGKGVGKILVKYPFFDPFANYPRKEIQNLEYYKRLEVFFNEEKFKSVVLQYSGQTKEKLKKENIKKNSEEEDVVEMNDNKISNFEFTIQTILCTGFPVNNYFQSIEYYNPKIRTKSLTLKGSSSWFPFLPGRFDRKFSHLKIGGGFYTVTGVVWINDAFNHPKYSPVLESYGKYNDEKKPTEIEKKLVDVSYRRDIELNMFVLNMYRDNLNQSNTPWRSVSIKSLKDLKKDRQYSREKESTSLDIQISFQEDILKKLLYAPEIVNMFDHLEISGNYYSKFADFTEIENNIYYQRTDANSKYKLEEIESIKKQKPENKSYYYWKQLHEFDTDVTNGLNGLLYTKLSGFNTTYSKHEIELYGNIYETYKKKQSFKPDIIPIKELELFLDDYDLKKTYLIEKKKNNEIYWLYKIFIENYKDIKTRTVSLPVSSAKRAVYDKINELMLCFIDDENGNQNNRNKQLKENIEVFLGKFTDDQFRMLGNVNYADSLRVFVRKMRGYDIEKRAYTYVQSNADFTDDPNKSEIDAIIAQKFKNFNVYSNSLKELANSRIVANPFWKTETDKFVGIKKGKITLKVEKNKSDMFETLTNCKEFNSRCRKNKEAADYLYTNLDELKTSGEKGLTVYEAYIQTNVIKGKITKDNYSSLKCAYLNYSLGAMYQRMRKKTRENYIVKNKVYFDLEDKIKQVDADLMKKSSFSFWPMSMTKKANVPANKKAAAEPNKNDKKKKGGRRSRKNRKNTVIKKIYTHKKSSRLGLKHKTRRTHSS